MQLQLSVQTPASGPSAGTRWRARLDLPGGEQGPHSPALLQLEHLVPQGLVQLVKERGDIDRLLHHRLLDRVEAKLSLLS